MEVGEEAELRGLCLSLARPLSIDSAVAMATRHKAVFASVFAGWCGGSSIEGGPSGPSG